MSTRYQPSSRRWSLAWVSDTLSSVSRTSLCALHALAVAEHPVGARVAHHVAPLARRDLRVAPRDLALSDDDVARRIAADHHPSLRDEILLAVDEGDQPAARRGGGAGDAG